MIAIATALIASCAVVTESDRVTESELGLINAKYSALVEEFERQPLTFGKCDSACTSCVRLRILGASTRIRIDAEREGRVASADLTRPLDAQLDAVLRPLVWSLHTPPAAAQPALAPADRGISVGAPTIALGGTALLAVGAGIVFGVSSASARTALEEATSDSSRTLELASRMDDHAIAANVLLLAGVLAAMGTLTLLAIDSRGSP
ncbi:MAG: hypothetical protein HYV07_08790 [Deltaproteobacteria bacterium]|nr:hypothetical protein [Deltaproteobacteria bacterium]